MLRVRATINANISATMTAAFLNGRKLSEEHLAKLTTSSGPSGSEVPTVSKAIEVLDIHKVR
jgi:hypothetical protein